MWKRKMKADSRKELSPVHDTLTPSDSNNDNSGAEQTAALISPSDLRREARRNAEFGPLGHPSHLYTSQHAGGAITDPIIDEPPYFYMLTTYISFLILIFVGHTQDFLARWFTPYKHRHLMVQDG